MAKVANLTAVAELVAKETGWSMKDSRDAVKVTFEAVGKQLKKNDRVTITGVGSFSKTKTKAQKGGKKATNPFTGEEYITKPKPARTKVKFRPGKNFKETVGAS